MGTEYTPKQMYNELEKLVQQEIYDPLLIIGESGVGKSAMIRQIGAKHDLSLADVRWGQLAPVDARGVPVADRDNKLTEFYPPSMWPRKGPGIIFLDEFNMASTAMMGLGQQLLLDRQFGDYKVPDGVFVWAAGNRKIDRAAVNEIPAPVKNRVAHYEVVHDLDSWEIWAYASGIDPRIIGFLKFRPELLHKFDPNSPDSAWPSPRTWEMANRRLMAGMSLEPVVGSASIEFEAYQIVAEKLPHIESIANGRGGSIRFPEEPSLQFALISGLIHHALKSWPTYVNCFKWLSTECRDSPEWIQMFVMDVIKVQNLSNPKAAAVYMDGLTKLPEAKRFIDEYVTKITEARVSR